MLKQFILFISLTFLAAASAKLELCVIFNSLMVLQQNEDNRVWGWSDPDKYIDRFSAMITRWRALWNQGDFSYYYVQIAPCDYGKQKASWIIRDAQLKTMNLVPNVGMATIGDSLRTVRYTTLFLIWSFIALPVFGLQNASTLESIKDVRALSTETSADALPVHFEAQVVRKSNQDRGFFLFDGEYGIYAEINESVALAQKVQVGDLIKIKGTTISGTFAPSVLIDRLEVVENRPLPKARYLLPFEFSSESTDCDWVKIRGRLVAFKEHKSHDSIHVTLQHDQTTINIRIPSAPGYIEGLQSKLFEWVELAAVAGVVSNPERQFIQRVFYANSADDFMVMPREINQKEIETVPIHQLRHYGNDSREVVRTYGRVTHVADYEVFVRGEKASLKSTYPESEYVTIGQLVELEGIVMAGAVAPAFRARSIKVIGKKEIPLPRGIDLSEAIPLNLDAELVKIQAELVQVSTPLIAPLRQDLVLICKTGERQFEARLKRGYDPGYSLEPGSIIEIVGISHVESYEFVPWNINPTVWIQLRSRDDIQIIQMPPWWNTTRLIWIGSVVSGVALTFLIWTIILRRIVDRQKRFIHRKVEQEVIEGERHRIARELHDNLSQGLVGMGIQLQSRIRRIEKNAAEVCVGIKESDVSTDTAQSIVSKIERFSDEDLASLRSLYDKMDRCSEESRSSIMYLRRGAAGRMGMLSALQEALEPLGDESDAMLSITLEGEPRALKQELERNLMMIAKEAVTNAVRHSGAGEIDVVLNFNGKGVEISVKDNGRGFAFNTIQKKGHFGLVGMKERIKQFGGLVNIQSAPDSGTEVMILLKSTRAWEV